MKTSLCLSRSAEVKTVRAASCLSTRALQATVGAGLPVIATLKHLRETGDKITRVEGIFSGEAPSLKCLWLM